MSKNTQIYLLENTFNTQNREQIQKLAGELLPQVFLNEINKPTSLFLKNIVSFGYVELFPKDLIKAIPLEVLLRPNNHKLTPLELIIKTKNVEHFEAQLQTLTTEMLIAPGSTAHQMLQCSIERDYFKDLPERLITPDLLLAKNSWGKLDILDSLISHNQLQHFQNKITKEVLLTQVKWNQYDIIELFIKHDLFQNFEKLITNDDLLVRDTWNGYPLLELLAKCTQLQTCSAAKELLTTDFIVSEEKVLELLMQHKQLSDFLNLSEVLDYDMLVNHNLGSKLLKYALRNLEPKLIIDKLPKDAISLLSPVGYRENETLLEIMDEAGQLQHFKEAIDSINMTMLSDNGLLKSALKSKCFAILREKISLSTDELLTRTDKGVYPIVDAIISNKLQQHFTEAFNGVTKEMLLAEYPCENFLLTLSSGQAEMTSEPTLLKYAIICGYLEYFQAAFSALTPADIITPTSEYGQTPLQFIARWNKQGAFKKLIDGFDVALLFTNDPFGNMLLKHAFNPDCFSLLSKQVLEAVDQDVMSMRVNGKTRETVLENVVKNGLFDFLLNIVPIEKVATFSDNNGNTILHHILNHPFSSNNLPQDISNLFNSDMLLVKNSNGDNPLSIILPEEGSLYLTPSILKLITLKMLEPHLANLKWSENDIASVFSNFTGAAIIKLLNINTNYNLNTGILKLCYDLIESVEMSIIDPEVDNNSFSNMPMDQLMLFHHPVILCDIPETSRAPIFLALTSKFFTLFVCKDFISEKGINLDIFKEIIQHLEITDLISFPMVDPFLLTDQNAYSLNTIGDSDNEADDF